MSIPANLKKVSPIKRDAKPNLPRFARLYQKWDHDLSSPLYTQILEAYREYDPECPEDMILLYIDTALEDFSVI